MLRHRLALLVFSVIIARYGSAQVVKVADGESYCVGLYAKILQLRDSDPDSSAIYADRFEKDFNKLIATNPETFNYTFSQLTDSNFCFIRTSPDGNLKIYSWDTWLGGTMHEFRTIYQWRYNDIIYSKMRPVNGDIGSFCSKIYCIMVAGKPHYLVITNAIFSNKDASQTVTAYTINGSKLDNKATIFHTKTKSLSSISVEFDFFSVVDRPERPVELIVYDKVKRSLFIPVVDSKSRVTSKHLMYKLTGKGLVYAGIQ